ncbi:MAG: glycosyltransferase, partial [Candidatus Omnitrophica bacterium]|nr:glycosyltransferase [Candidatus Omnitrophota bacterium]
MAEQKIDISIIVACYNEMQVIKQSLPRIEEIMRVSRYSYEIILYDDGSTDGTRELGPLLAAQSSNIIWKQHENNLGRGQTVRDGLALARGRISGFIDMD